MKDVVRADYLPRAFLFLFIILLYARILTRAALE